MPVTTVRKGEDKYGPSDYRDSLSRAAHDSMKGSVGMPMSVQILTPKYQDEKCLHIMTVLESLVERQARR